MHLVFINFVLGFSGIVLTESILSYLGVGVPSARRRGRDDRLGAHGIEPRPMVWWNIGAAASALFSSCSP